MSPRKRNTKRDQDTMLWNRNALVSPLLRIPAELRLAIYELVLGGLTIMLDEKQFGPQNNNMPKFFANTRNPYSRKVWKITVESSPRPQLTLLNGVCRQLYKETALLPFKLNTWAFNGEASMRAYTIGNKRLDLGQRRAIRKLSLDVWFRQNHFIPPPVIRRSLPGLRFLFIRIGTAILKYKAVEEKGKRKDYV